MCEWELYLAECVNFASEMDALVSLCVTFCVKCPFCFFLHFFLVLLCVCLCVLLSMAPNG